jgi:hypothetical protein
MNVTAALSANIAGISFWSPRLPSWELARAYLRGEAVLLDTPQSRPAPTLLAPAERRRAPDSVAIALEVAAQACRAAQLTAQELTSIFASTHGDLAISDYLCATLATTPTHISPTKFHNSVHNAPAGYWTIGTNTHTPYTAISAHEYTFAAGLLEAMTQLLCDDRPVLYVAYDIEARGPIATMAPSVGMFAVALILSTTAAHSQSRITLQVLSGASQDVAPPSVASPVYGNALANAVPFFTALATGARQVDLPMGRELRLCAELT